MNIKLEDLDSLGRKILTAKKNDIVNINNKFKVKFLEDFDFNDYESSCTSDSVSWRAKVEVFDNEVGNFGSVYIDYHRDLPFFKTGYMLNIDDDDKDKSKFMATISLFEFEK